MLVIFRVGSVSGNTQLEKWSTNSIRRAGLCADHFTENSFKGEGKKLLKRSVPIPFKNIFLSKEHNKDVDMESMSIAVEVIDNEKNINVTEAKKKDENSTKPATLGNIENGEMTEQSFQWPPLRTYRSPRLHFDMTSEEENVMDWIHLEPPICEKILNNNTNRRK